MKGVPQFMPIVSPVHKAAVEGGSALQPGAPAAASMPLAAMPSRTAVPGLMKVQSSFAAPAPPTMDLQSSTDNCNGEAGFPTRGGARGTAVSASSRAQAAEPADQTMQLATGGADSDAAGGSAPMEGVEDMSRCNRGPHPPHHSNFPSEVFGC